MIKKTLCQPVQQWLFIDLWRKVYMPNTRSLWVQVWNVEQIWHCLCCDISKRVEWLLIFLLFHTVLIIKWQITVHIKTGNKTEFKHDGYYYGHYYCNNYMFLYQFLCTLLNAPLSKNVTPAGALINMRQYGMNFGCIWKEFWTYVAYTYSLK